MCGNPPYFFRNARARQPAAIAALARLHKVAAADYTLKRRPRLGAPMLFFQHARIFMVITSPKFTAKNPSGRQAGVGRNKEAAAGSRPPLEKSARS